MFKIGDKVELKDKYTGSRLYHQGIAVITSSRLNKYINEYQIDFVACDYCQKLHNSAWYSEDSLQLVEPKEKPESDSGSLTDLEYAELIIRREIQKMPDDWTTSKQLLRTAADNIYKVLRSV